MRNLRNVIELNSGYSIPSIGFGTWQSEPEKVSAAVAKALECGFRHVDTAAAYNNEPEVGEGLRLGMRRCGLQRDDIFVTSKVWNTDRGYGRTVRACEKTLQDLGLDYIDLYLIHWPAVESQYKCWKELNAETWAAMEDLVQRGLVRSIGVSNFMERHLEPLLEGARIVPAVDQIEFHPGWTQPECVAYLRGKGIAVEAWSPLANGDALRCQELAEIAARYGVSISQLVLNWVAAQGIIPLTKSVTPGRIEENSRSLDFEVAADDLALISALEGVGGKCRNPDVVHY